MKNVYKLEKCHVLFILWPDDDDVDVYVRRTLREDHSVLFCIHSVESKMWIDRFLQVSAEFKRFTIFQ